MNSRSPRDRGECSGCPAVNVAPFSSPAHGFHASITDDLDRDVHELNDLFGILKYSYLSGLI